MKPHLSKLLFFFTGIVFGLIFYGTYQAQQPKEVVEIPKPEIQYVYVKSDPEIVTEYIYIPYEEPFYRNLTEDDVWCLKDMAMREAEGESVIGQCWVMYTVICRAEAFGMSIREVWASSAFKTSMFRTGLEPNDNCNEALALIEEGWTPKPLNFRRDAYHGFGIPLCQVGDHYFSYQ